jgi:hypothetical protein
MDRGRICFHAILRSLRLCGRKQVVMIGVPMAIMTNVRLVKTIHASYWVPLHAMKDLDD